MTQLPTNYQEFIHKSRYSRWIDAEQRRETWDETVERYLVFMWENTPMAQFGTKSKIMQELRDAILTLEIMPSMRAMMTAGAALKRENIAGYNCSYIPIDNPRSFDEIVYILMNGTGVGFSVERKFIEQLPSIPDEEFVTPVSQTCIAGILVGPSVDSVEDLNVDIMTLNRFDERQFEEEYQ